MSNDLDMRGRIELEIIAELDRATTQIAKLNEQLGHTSKVGNAAERGTARLTARAREMAGAQQVATKAAKETNNAIEAVVKSNNTLISTRYALYDVATTAGIASAALIAVAAATVGVASGFESSFTDVERTTLAGGESLESIRNQLLRLSRDIPVAFGDLTNVASIGAQLGIADTNLAGFTQTVTQFSAATNVASETAAMSFGALGELLDISAAEYNRLGSAIAYVGINSVATESEILSMSTRLAASAANAGFSAQEVVALSGALASLRVAPERAQGVMEVYFRVLNNAIADGGPRLERFAQIAGVAADEVAGLVRQDPNAFFRALADGLGRIGDADPVQLTVALGDLGLSGIRAGEVFTRVSKNLNVFDKALRDSNSAYEEGTLLAEIYGMRVDDIASRFQILLNSLQELAATAGTALLPTVGWLIDALADLANRLSDVIATPFGQWMSGTGIAIAAVIGGLLALAATAALASASFLAMRTVIQTVGWAGATTGIQGMMSAMFGFSTATGGAAVALNVFKVALASTGIGLAAVALGSLAAAMMNVGLTADKLFLDYVGNTAGLAEAVAADTTAYNEALASGNQALADSFTLLTPAAQGNTAAADDNARAIANAADILAVAAPRFDDVTGAAERNTQALGSNTTAWLKNALMQSDAFKELAKNQTSVDAWNAIGADFDEILRVQAAQGEAGVKDYYMRLSQAALDEGSATIEQIYIISGTIADALERARLGVKGTGGLDGLGSGFAGTLFGLNQGLINQMNLLGSVGQDAGASIASGMDDAADSVNRVGRGAGAAAKQIRTLADYAGDLSGVFDRAFDIRHGGDQGFDKIASGWHSIRNAIEDANQKIAEHQATIADLTADRAIKEYWLSVAENYGDALRAGELRADLLDIDQKLAKETKALTKAQDKNSKTLVGNTEGAIENRAEILGLVGDYQDYIAALAASGMSQADLEQKARQLKAEFISQATQLGYSRAEIEKYAVSFDDVATAINKIPRRVDIEFNGNAALTAIEEFMQKAKSAIGGGVNVPLTTSGNPAGQIRLMEADYARYRGLGDAESRLGDFFMAQKYYEAAAVVLGQLRGVRGYKDGGYTGNGSVNAISGVTHGKEFVFSEPAVRNIGVENLAYLHNMGRRGKGGSGGGGGQSARSGMVVAELSAFDRQLLMDIRDNIGIELAPSGITTLVGANNIATSRRGTA